MEIFRIKILVLCLLFMGLFSCSRDKIEPEGECTEIVTYVDDVKSIIDQTCATAGCHLNQAAPGDFSTYEGMSTYLESGNFKNRVVVIQNMPPNGSVDLTEEQLNVITCWANSDYLEE